MSLINIEGGTPLIGSVRLSGSKNSALKLIPAAMFSNEDVVLENVPRVEDIVEYTSLITRLGGKAEWAGLHKLVLNGSGISTYEIPADTNLPYRVAALLTGPLLFRFGKVILPKSVGASSLKYPINRWLDTWRALGFEVDDNENFLAISSGSVKNADINFKVSTHSGTENAIISSLFVPGETVINNAAEEVEMDDLISLANIIGGEVTRVEPRKIKVVGKNVFKGGKLEVQGDKTEAVIFSTAAVVTGGNITIEGVDRTHLTSFINVITKMNIKYEFVGKELRVWSTGENILPLNITTSASPGFLTDWHPFISLLLTKALGDSYIYDTVFTNRFEYVKDLNRMGARIDLVSPTAAGLECKISDDAYDIEKFGEPLTVAKISGPIKLKGNKLVLTHPSSAAALVLAALCAEGKSEIVGFDIAENAYEGFVEKLQSLGAKLARE